MKDPMMFYYWTCNFRLIVMITPLYLHTASLILSFPCSLTDFLSVSLGHSMRFTITGNSPLTLCIINNILIFLKDNLCCPITLPSPAKHYSTSSDVCSFVDTSNNHKKNQHKLDQAIKTQFISICRICELCVEISPISPSLQNLL